MTSPNLTELANKFKSDKGTEYFEKHGYTLVYEELFSLIKSEPLVFLEIGLCIGGPEFGDEFLERVPADVPSIRMWSEYFKNAHIYGFDINDFSFFEAAVENFKFIRGDLSLKQDIESLIKTTMQLEEVEEKAIYDVVIDDASHASFHQQQALSVLFPRVKSQGIYIIEDLHWQSENYERKLPEVPKTIDILMQLKDSENSFKETSKDYIFHESMMEFIPDIKSIDIYCDNKLAVIKKV